MGRCGARSLTELIPPGAPSRVSALPKAAVGAVVVEVEAILAGKKRDPAGLEQSDSPSECAMGERSGFCSGDGNVEEPLSPRNRWASPKAEVPGERDGRTCGRVVGELCALHPVPVLVLAVLVALVLALATAVAALSAGRRGGDAAVTAAPVLGCPEDWVGYRGACYYLSREEGSWEWSREQCSLRGAWLAVLRREWETEFLWRLKGNADYWLGLQRRGERLEWVDGSSFNQTFVVQGQGMCVYLYDGAVASSGCALQRPYLCSKPQALV